MDSPQTPVHRSTSDQEREFQSSVSSPLLRRKLIQIRLATEENYLQNLTTPSELSVSLTPPDNLTYAEDQAVDWNINTVLFENCEDPAENPKLHTHTASSIIPTDNYFNLTRKAEKTRIMEARGAVLLFPPVAVTLSLIQIGLFFFREKFGVEKLDDVYVSWQTVITDGDYKRLVYAQFFHFKIINLVVNIFTFYAIGRYLERKIKTSAMFIIIMLMSVTYHFVFIIAPHVCDLFISSGGGETSRYTNGFGNVLYSLRILLAFAMEPRNYERDLVFGLYPMVLSASYAPWQPILDLVIFKIVMPEQSMIGQLSGILAGGVCTWALLLWPTEGIYIAAPPNYWVPQEDEGGDQNEARRGSGAWRMSVYPSEGFWLPVGSESVADIASTPVIGAEAGQGHQNARNRAISLPTMNSLQRRSYKMKEDVGYVINNPLESLISLAKSVDSLISSHVPELDLDSDESTDRERKQQRSRSRRSRNESLREVMELHLHNHVEESATSSETDLDNYLDSNAAESKKMIRSKSSLKNRLSTASKQPSKTVWFQ